MRLFNPVTRQTIQPSFVLAMLVMSTLLQSSELELGTRGMNQALLLADQAYSAFHASLNSGWIDVGLAHAAYILVAFELQAHPEATRPQRTQEAMHMLNSIIRYLALTTLDVANPRVTIFLPNTVPRVSSNLHLIAAPPIASAPKKIAMVIMLFADKDENIPCPMPVPEQGAAADGYPRCGRCGCPSFSLGNHCPSVRMIALQFAHMPMWPAAEGALGEGEVLKEESRRLVWASVVLVTTLGSAKVMAMAGTGWDLQPLWIQDPSNYALLFPGECLADQGVVGVASSKDSVWALYMRAVLLWNACLRMRRDAAAGVTMPEAERA
ncbi:hypothetical protein TRAPUB_6271 [Trametes pubescens]|uniref:Transcription factor domain-containing protein n=1 Tax=Trametes pubescens TaxID=154538 RepID=A0A1M2V6F2_TRAPU|nr:hypothetical protein TRAPUB_6271 [Trametes pubescens]